VVRREAGCRRYDTDAERALIALICADLRLYVGFRLPRVKLIAKERVGAKVTKRHDRAATPYERLIAPGALDEATAARLAYEYLALNPAKLRRRLTDNERRLTRLCAQKNPGGGHLRGAGRRSARACRSSRTRATSAAL
jgi:hypothetical protein